LNLTTQKRIAADILKVGVNRVWIDPKNTKEVSRAITREGVKQLIGNGIIKAKPKKVSAVTGLRRSQHRNTKEEGKAVEV